MSEIRKGQVDWLDLAPAKDYFDRNRAVTGRERLAQLDMFFRGAAPKSAIATCVPKASIVNISQIITVDKAELVEYAGKLSGAAPTQCATDCICSSSACDILRIINHDSRLVNEIRRAN